MDFQSMKRKQLQALCKKHNIPANLSSLQLAQNLSSLLQEKEKPAKRGRPSSKAETVEDNNSGVAPRQLKKVRFSPNSEMFEFVHSGRKGKTKAMTTKSEMKPRAKKRANTVAAKVDAVESNEEVVGKAVRSLSSRVTASAGGGVISVVKPPAEKKRARKVGKYVDEVESRQELVISAVRATRSTVQTSTENGIIPVSKRIVEKKRGRGVIKDFDAVEVVASSPVRVTRSRAQTSVEGGEVLALKPQAEKKRTRGVVKDVDPAKDIVDGPVRTTRSRAQTSMEGVVATMPSSPIEKKRARTGIKVGAKTVKSTDADLDIPVTLVSQEAAADRAEDLPLKRSLRQKNQKHKAVKGNVKVCEDEPLATDIGMTEQKLCLRRTTRNAVKLGDLEVLNRSTDETEMGGRGKITRSRNQLAPKDNSDMKTETAVMDQMKSETMLQAGEPLGRTGRNYNRRKSVIPRETGNRVKVQGTSQTVPKLEEPVRRSSRKGSKQNSIVPKVDEMETTELITEKGDVLKENEMVVPAIGPLRSSRRQTLQLESIALTGDELPSCVIAGRKRPGNQTSKGFKAKVLVKGLRQDASGGKSSVPSAARSNSSMKQRGASNFGKRAIDVKCAPLGEESAIRFTRSAAKNESNAAARNSEKVVRKKQQHCRTETPNLVLRTPSPEEVSVIKGQPSLDAQFCMPQVTKSLSDQLSGSSQVVKSSNSKNRSEGRKTRSSKQGVEEAKGQTSPSKSERFHTDDVEKDKEISMRKRRGGSVFKEDVEKSSRRFKRSAVISEKNTEPDLPVKSAQEKVHGRSKPPTLAVDEDSASYGKLSLGAKFSVPEVLKGPRDLFAGCTDVIKDSSKKSTKSCRSTRSSKQARLPRVHAETSDVEEAKGKASSSKSGSSQTYDRQQGMGISVRKRRVNAFQEVAVDFVCATPAEESSRRLTRSVLKGGKSAPTNPEKSAGRKKRLSRSEAPKLDVKISTAEGNLSAHGLANLDPQFLSPKDLESATVSRGVVIDESSSKERKKLFSVVPAVKQDSTQDVSAQSSHITEGKCPILNFEETLASESERFQIDELEKEVVDSISETIVASEVNVIQGLIVPSNESLCGTIASEIELAPEIELSSIQNSPGQFTSTAVMSGPESPNLAMEVPSELGSSALKAAPSIATVPELQEGANNLGLGRGDIIKDNSTSEVKKSNMVFQVIEEGSSDEVHTETLGKNEANVLVNRVALSASEPLRLQDGRDPQMEISVGEAVLFAADTNNPIGVDRDHSGSQSILTTGFSTKLADQEAVEDLSIADDAGFARTASYSPTKVREMDGPSTCEDEDSLLRAKSKLSADQDNKLCTKQLNPEIFDNEKNAGSAEHHESSSSPVRKSIELEVPSTEKSHTIDELPLQVLVTFENATISLLSSNEEPSELGDGKGMVSTTNTYSEKQKTFVNVLSGYEAADIGSGNASGTGNEIIEAHSFDRKKICDGISQEMHITDNEADNIGIDREIIEAHTFERKKICDGISQEMHINDNQDSVKGVDVDDSLQEDEEIAHDLLTPLKDNDETRLGCTNKEVGDYGFGISESLDTVPAEESQHAEHPSKDDQLQTTGEEINDGVCTERGQDYYQFKDLFETPASRVHSCEEETSTKVTEMTHLVLAKDRTPSTLESRDNTPLQRSLNATVDNESMEDLTGDWSEDPLQSSFPKPGNGSCISSKDAPPCGRLAYSETKIQEIERNKDPEGYFESHLENEIETYKSFASLDASDFDGDEENTHIYGGSNSVEGGENNLKEAVSDEKARNVDEFSDEQLHNNKGVIEDGHCNSGIGCWASNKPSYGTKVHISTDKTNETDDFLCSLTDANTSAVLGEQRMVDLSMKLQMLSTQEANRSTSDNKGDEAEKSSSGLSWEDNKVRGSYTMSAEEQFREPEKNVKLFYGGTSDVNFCEYNLTEGFNDGGDTEEYFESENTHNANVKESFDGMTQDEFLMDIDHEYTVLPEPGMGGEISRMEAQSTADVDNDKPMAHETCEEREKPQLGEAASLMNSRTESPKMFSGTDTSGSVHFALDKVKKEKPDAKAEEGNEYAKQLDSASTAIENNNATASLIRGASYKPVLDMKENALNLKGEHGGILSSARRMTCRHALEDLEKK